MANSHAMTLTPGCDPTVPDVMRENEENEEEIINNSCIKTKN